MTQFPGNVLSSEFLEPCFFPQFHSYEKFLSPGEVPRAGNFNYCEVAEQAYLAQARSFQGNMTCVHWEARYKWATFFLSSSHIALCGSKHYFLHFVKCRYTPTNVPKLN
jgi:hypothetical protein